MNPLEFPELYFYYAAANYNLKHFDVAEANAKRATEVDNAHEIPRAELLLASTLIARGDRAGALQHFKKYLEIVPKAADAEQVKRAVASWKQRRLATPIERETAPLVRATTRLTH